MNKTREKKSVVDIQLKKEIDEQARQRKKMQEPEHNKKHETKRRLESTHLRDLNMSK